MISAFIKGQTLKIVAPVIVADSIKYLESKFHFQTSDWDGFSKWAHFKNGETVYDIRLNADDAIRKSDNLNLGAGTWEVYLHGTSKKGERITTDVANIEVKQSGALDGEPFPNVPLSVVEQLDERVSRLEEGTGGGGGTPGGQGVPGGYYKPSLDQVDEQTVVFSFEKSQETMEDLPEENIVLPAGKPGTPGTTPLMRVNDTTNEWEVSYDNGTSWESTGVKATGDKGDPGVSIKAIELSKESAAGNSYSIHLTDGSESEFTAPAGPAGYSPVLGTDYWTEADKAEIKSYVDEAILGGAW